MHRITLVRGVLPLMLRAAASALAQSYPVRPMRLVMPFPPGGSNDIVGRVVAASLGERLGKQVIVDNRAGGNSIIGTEIVATAQPDGYTRHFACRGGPRPAGAALCVRTRNDACSGLTDNLRSRGA